MNTRVTEGRTALAITVLLIATLTVPAVLFGAASGFAQGQQSPSPSGTAPQIELLNPSDHSNVISDKDSDPSAATDPTDTQYHFNAWARNIPPNPLAEFFIVQGNTVLQVGSSTLDGFDTFDLFAAIPDGLTETTFDPQGAPASNTAIVRVILYSNNGATEVDRDDQTVIVNQHDDESSQLAAPTSRRNAAETVEMTYPINTAGMGFFTQQGQPSVGTIDVTSSAGTDNVTAWYTTSPVGTEPAWDECSAPAAGVPTPRAGETRANSADGVRCTLDSGVRPDQVTAMGAVAMDDESSAPNAPVSQAKNAGDAHRAVGFEQDPAAVFVSSHTAVVADCSPLVTVRVQDSSGHDVSNAQVDVHAQGPSDNVAFNTDDADTDAAGDPDPNDPPENHTTESGRDCSDESFGGTQGNHAVGGGFDRKHIESTSRTDDNGEFTYEMYSDVAGGTTMTAWVDRDDDDRFCATERGGSGSITWGSGGPPAPNPEGPEIQTCPAASPSGSPSSTSPTGTASPTPTPSPTQSSPTPSPTGTQTTSPTPSPTGTQTTSPTPSPTGTATTTTGGGTTTTGTAQQAAVEVTLDASQSRKTFGKSFTLSGSVTSSNPACTDFVSVRILRDVVGGADEFELWAQEQTDANGAYSVTDRADRSANYVGQVTATETCDDASSSPETVLVRVKVSLRLSRDMVQPGDRVRFRIKTAPCPATARDKVLLFRAIEGEFGKSGRKRTNQRCAATIVRRVNQSSVFQARWPKQSPEFLAGRSRSKAVRVER
ncbi:MAG: hypothetical protein M3323_07080 [Actinomycetota bacterium]|nr:hypothetical protein [Actinomycetota bacterium]